MVDRFLFLDICLQAVVKLDLRFRQEQSSSHGVHPAKLMSRSLSSSMPLRWVTVVIDLPQWQHDRLEPILQLVVRPNRKIGFARADASQRDAQQVEKFPAG
jgi:hypothetical protein